jgi:hypothetical protein
METKKNVYNCQKMIRNLFSSKKYKLEQELEFFFKLL